MDGMSGVEWIGGHSSCIHDRCMAWWEYLNFLFQEKIYYFLYEKSIDDVRAVLYCMLRHQMEST